MQTKRPLTHGWLGPIRQTTDIQGETAARLAGQEIQPTTDSRRDAREIFLLAYQAAGRQMLTLEAAVAIVTDPEERRALYRLYALEVHRRELARLSAEALWGIQLGADEIAAAA